MPQITLAEEGDANEILELISRYFPYMPLTLEQITTRLNDPNYMVLKSVENKKITGFIEMEIIDLVKRYVQLNAIVVKPPHRRPGHAQALVQSGLAWAEDLGMSKVILLVEKDNAPAKNLYEKNGLHYAKDATKLLNGKKSEWWEVKLELPPPDYVM
jgi:ribosomal protein S18 acetylase RimI-like enzyme